MPFVLHAEMNAASTRTVPMRKALEKVWSKSWPGRIAHPCAANRDLSSPLRFTLYAQTDLMTLRPLGTSVRLINTHEPCESWLLSSLRSDVAQPVELCNQVASPRLLGAISLGDSTAISA